MIKKDKELIVVGDRVLVHVEEGEERTTVGLYLPSTAIDNQAVQGGKIVATGPGLPMPSPDSVGEEPWNAAERQTRVLPRQARTGDYAFFFRKAAVEITFEGDRYLVVPQAAILALVSEEEGGVMRLHTPMYDARLVSPMRQELTRLGVEELRTPDEVDQELKNAKGTTLVVVNSVCGCAARRAPPAEAIRRAKHS